MISWINLYKFNFNQECYSKCCNKIIQKSDINIITTININNILSAQNKTLEKENDNRIIDNNNNIIKDMKINFEFSSKV